VHKQALIRTEPGQPAESRSRRLHARNRVLATLLAGIAALGFITVMSLAGLLHYAEAHHLLANL
jgi:hypothetical protein